MIFTLKKIKFISSNFAFARSALFVFIFPHDHSQQKWMKEGKKKNSRLCRRVKKNFFIRNERNFQLNFSHSEWIKNGKEVHLIDRLMMNKCVKVISGE